MRPNDRRQTVLVIDDDAIVRLMATEALSDAGYVVVEAPDAESGWERFVRSGADLVLLDVILPGMNGFEACARLRAHAAGANVPIIMMTGLDDRISIASAFDAGATDFITKPIVWDLLPYRVRYALRASDAFQETLRSRALLNRSQSLANRAERLGASIGPGRVPTMQCISSDQARESSARSHSQFPMLARDCDRLSRARLRNVSWNASLARKAYRAR